MLDKQNRRGRRPTQGRGRKTAFRRRAAAARARAFGCRPERRSKSQAERTEGGLCGDIQAKEQSEQRGGKRARGRERSGGGQGRGDNRRRELSLKSERRTKRKQPHRDAPLQVDQQGGEFKPTEFISREVEVGEMITVGELPSVWQ